MEKAGGDHRHTEKETEATGKLSMRYLSLTAEACYMECTYGYPFLWGSRLLQF